MCVCVCVMVYTFNVIVCVVGEINFRHMPVKHLTLLFGVDVLLVLIMATEVVFTEEIQYCGNHFLCRTYTVVNA